ncbi:non-homologous end-joining DNA ligase [Piscinibacter koreensis]|uniref:DNA polymerase domain-containing protein n=1 Tax=Piscinibacter koreensis TaxID=2742824 RepID=A0A7Y6NM85_9BURK|nr:non-homologous end-joining DNA ligase [Schlegelella koreensis]NUZ05783.1 DNA polymerase domain-containing protein [Schlegelella koreensis]
MPADDALTLDIDGRTVAVTHPDKLLIAEAQVRKIDLVNYMVAVAEGALRGAGGRPCVLVRHPDGIGGEFFFQKRAPANRPDWLEVASIRFPSGRSADEVVPRHASDLAWMANLACLELHPHPVRADDLEHPDELRVDLDPVPGVEWPQIREVARVVHAVLDEFGLVGWPKTSGSRGVHVLVRIERRWSFDQVRRAALALAREVERRAPSLATSAWWKEERHGVFIDYNQNAKDRTVASAYSVRPRSDARVSAPVSWAELDACDPADFTLWTMPKRVAAIGDPHADIDRLPAGSIEALLELSARHEAEGQGDAPWPPHYRKAAGEPRRAPPSTGKGSAGAKTREAPGAEGKSAAAGAGGASKTPGRKRASPPAPSRGAEGSAGAGSPPASGRRRPKVPLIEIARAEREDDAIAAAEAWKASHPDAAAHLAPADVLVDRMRGSSSLWYRVRINLERVPPELRPQVPRPG